MTLDVSEVALDPDAGSCFQIVRQNPGKQALGGWQPGGTNTILAFGIVTRASPKALLQVPEGDRVEGSLQIVCNQPLYVTSAKKQATSDQIQWCGELYRVQNVAPWGQWGYYSAIAVREVGN